MEVAETWEESKAKAAMILLVITHKCYIAASEITDLDYRARVRFYLHMVYLLVNLDV